MGHARTSSCTNPYESRNTWLVFDERNLGADLFLSRNCDLTEELQIPFHISERVPLSETIKHRDTLKALSFTRLKEFNPGSRDHIAWILTHRQFPERDYYDFWENENNKTTLKNHGTGISQQFLRILEITRLPG